MAEQDDLGICPLCQLPIDASESVPCPKCGRPAHVGCWQRVGRCATKGCEGQPAGTSEIPLVEDTTPAGTCPRCGYRLGPLESRCPRCQPERAEGMDRLADRGPRAAEGDRAGPPAPTHQLGGVDEARTGPTADPFRKFITRDESGLPQAPAPTAAPRVEVQPENTSGGLGTVPGEARGWNWGALVLGPAWLAGHGLWGLLLVWVALAVAAGLAGAAYRPFLGGGLGLLILYLGMAGNGLAWKARRFDSITHFQRVQRIWARWAGAALFLAVVLTIMTTFAVFCMRRLPH